MTTHHLLPQQSPRPTPGAAPAPQLQGRGSPREPAAVRSAGLEEPLRFRWIARTLGSAAQHQHLRMQLFEHELLEQLAPHDLETRERISASRLPCVTTAQRRASANAARTAATSRSRAQRKDSPPPALAMGPAWL